MASEGITNAGTEAEYHDADYPVAKLTMLGAKSSCKDRWRQVLSEAARLSHKHLIMLEPGITRTQTDEMQQSNLQLIVITHDEDFLVGCVRWRWSPC